MEMKTTRSHGSYFWQSLIICIIIFAVGIYLGYLLEANRAGKILELYQQSELDMLDIKTQDSILSMKDFNCNSYYGEIISFADRIYNEAKILDRYETANEFSEGMVLQHKKYDLLRALLWVQAIEMKKKCNSSLNTLVYFYEYKSENLDSKAEQNVFSKKLSELKEQNGNNVILIPMAGNMNLTSIEILKNNYNITKLPVILINEKTKIENLDGLGKIQSYIR